MGEVRLNPPRQRECVRCGRRDRWDDDARDWRIRVVDGEKQSGDRYCLHEWDITGTHKPITE